MASCLCSAEEQSSARLNSLATTALLTELRWCERKVNAMPFEAGLGKSLS